MKSNIVSVFFKNISLGWGILEGTVSSTVLKLKKLHTSELKRQWRRKMKKPWNMKTFASGVT